MARRRGSQVFHAFAFIVRQTRAPQDRRGLRGGLLSLLAIVVFHAAFSLSAGGHQTDAAEADGPDTPLSLARDTQDGDPPQAMLHRRLHLKKPRFSALHVWTEPASPSAAPAPAFRADDARRVSSEETRTPRASLPDPVPTHRCDASLRLHPGQAPPHIA